MGSIFVLTFFLCTLKQIWKKHQGKLQKILKDKNEAKKSHETYMKRLKEEILKDKQLPTSSLLITLRLLPLHLRITLHLLHLSLPQDPVILMSTALVYLLSLPQEFVYFLRTTRRQGKSSMNNPLNQNDVICFRSDDEKPLYNKLTVIVRKTLRTLLKMQVSLIVRKTSGMD